MRHSPHDHSARSDEDLVAAANRGEQDAFASLYRRHGDWVWSLARRFSSNADDAADVMQDAFLHLWGRFPGFRLTARLRTFLYPVVRHLALERRRKAAREAGSGEVREESLVDVSAPIGGQVREELATALAALSPPQREVVLMRFVDDLDLAEIAEALEIPVGTAKSRLHHALARLREDPGTRDALR